MGLVWLLTLTFSMPFPIDTRELPKNPTNRGFPELVGVKISWDPSQSQCLMIKTSKNMVSVSVRGRVGDEVGEGHRDSSSVQNCGNLMSFDGICIFSISFIKIMVHSRKVYLKIAKLCVLQRN